MEQQPARRNQSGGSQAGGFFGNVVGDIRETVGSLIRQEITLVRTEMTQNMKAFGKDAALVGGGGALAYAGFLVVLAGVVNVVSRILPRWLAAFLVGLTAITVGAIIIQRGQQNIRHADLKPEATIDSIKAGAESARRQVSQTDVTDV